MHEWSFVAIHELRSDPRTILTCKCLHGRQQLAFHTHFGAINKYYSLAIKNMIKACADIQA